MFLRLAFCCLSAIALAAGRSATENPAFMMMSGVSSTLDMCLVVENGCVFAIFVGNHCVQWGVAQRFSV